MGKDLELEKFLESQEYVHITFSPELGGYVLINRYLFTWAIIQGADYGGFKNRWCYPDKHECLKSFYEWISNPTTENPPGNWKVRKGRKPDYQNPNYKVVEEDE